MRFGNLPIARMSIIGFGEQPNRKPAQESVRQGHAGKMSQIKHIFPDRLSARLYPFEIARKYNNPGNLSIHNVFELSSLDWWHAKTPLCENKAYTIKGLSPAAVG
jgi:hypothetical protein